MDFADLMALDLIDMAEKSLQKIEKAVGNRPAEVAVNPQDITDMKEAMINLTLLLTQLDKKVEDLTEIVKSNHRVVAYEEPIPDTVDLTSLNRLAEMSQINKTEEKKPSTRKKQDKKGSEETKLVLSSYMISMLIKEKTTKLLTQLNALDFKITDKELKALNILEDYISVGIEKLTVYLGSDGSVYVTRQQTVTYRDIKENSIRVRERDKQSSSDVCVHFSRSTDWVKDLEPVLKRDIKTLRTLRVNNKPKNRADEDLIIPTESKPTLNVVQKGGHVEDVYTLDESTRLRIARNTLPYDDDLRFYKDKNDNILCSNNLINLNDGDLVRTGVLKGYDEEDAEGDVLEYKQRINLSYKLNPEDIVMAIAYLQPKKRISSISSILPSNDTTWINNKRKEFTEELMGLEEEEEEEEDEEEVCYTLDEGTRLDIARNSLPYDMDLHYYKDTNDNILSSVDLINVEKEGIVRADTRTLYRGDERRLGNVLEYGTISKKSRYRVIYDKVYLMAIVYLQPKKNISFIREVLSTKDTTWINNKRKELSGLFFTDLEA